LQGLTSQEDQREGREGPSKRKDFQSTYIYPEETRPKGAE